MILKRKINIEGKEYTLNIEIPEIVIDSGRSDKEKSTYLMYFKNINGGFISHGKHLSQASSHKEGLERGFNEIKINLEN